MNRRNRRTNAVRNAAFEALESRRLLTTAYAVTTDNNLLTFDTATPGTATTVAVTGLEAAETLVGIDVRPATGALIGVGSTSRVYSINPTTGVATQINSTPWTPALSGTAFGVDFNPTVDRLRIVSDADQNLRIHPVTGAVANTDTTLAYEAADTNALANPNVVAAAYTNNVAGGTPTTLHGIDSTLDILVTQNPPNNGTLNTVGALGFDTGDNTGFDIDAVGLAFASLTAPAGTSSSLYTINLTTGAATLVGVIGGGTVAVTDIAISLGGVFALSAPTYTVAEDGVNAVITINRTGDTSGSATLTLSTADLTATAGSDYTAVTATTVNFAPTETSKTVNIPITDDPTDEVDETVNVTIATPSGGVLNTAASTAVLTITDNDAGPLGTLVTLSAATYTVSESGTNAVITINRSGDLTGTSSVTLNTSDGTATAGSDYTAVTTSVVTFAATETTKTVNIPITSDTTDEPDETVNIAISAPTNATLGAQTAAVLTITDDDTPGQPTVQFSAATFTENENGTNASVTVTRVGDTTGVSTVSFATSNGTATAGSDYTATTTTVSFAAGEAQKLVQIPITDDNSDEPNETVTLTLSAPSGATLGTQSTATLTIVDNDSGAGLAPDPATNNRNLLLITGTNEDDTIRVIRRGGNNLEAFVNGVTLGVFKNPSRLVVQALAGNDVVRIQAGIKQSSEQHGGAGNDVLLGAAGRDLLIGGDGIDVLLGRNGDDILIGDTTSLDDNLDATAAIMRVWLGRGGITARSNAIQTGTGVAGGFAFNNTTITSDDVLDVDAGDLGADVIFNSTPDVLTDDDGKDVPVVIPA